MKGKTIFKHKINELHKIDENLKKNVIKYLILDSK